MQSTPLTLVSLYRTHRVPLCRKVMHRGVRPDDADDVVQDLFVSLLQTLRAGATPPANVVAWVYAAADHKAVDYLRRARARPELSPATGEAPLTTDAALAAPSAEEQLIRDEQQRFLHAALQAMEPARQVVFEHRALYGLSVAETAAALQLPETTVRARYEAAQEELEAAYERWRVKQSWRTGALAFPLSVDMLVERERERLGAVEAHAAPGGAEALLRRLQADDGVFAVAAPRLLDDAAPPRASTRRAHGEARATFWSPVPRFVRSHGPGFLVGGAVGALVLWFLLRTPTPPPLVCAPPSGDALTCVPPEAAIPWPPRAAPLGSMHAEPVPILPPEPDTFLAPTAACPALPLQRMSAPGRATEATEKATDQGMIQAARTARAAGDFTEARRILREHAQRFPDSASKVAREALLASLPQPR